MSRYLLTSLLIFLLICTEAHCGPVGRTRTGYTQPDGTTFTVQVTGDEWLRIRKTEDGCAIIRDDEGWWCYGIYGTDGSLRNTGFRVGKPAPADTMAASRMIPMDLLVRNAGKRRLCADNERRHRAEAVRRKTAAVKSGSQPKTLVQGLILLVEFNDTKFRYSKEDFTRLMNENGYNGTGSAKDYYEDQFGAGWEFQFDVSDIITLSWPVSHYGKNDKDDQDIRPWDMVKEACQAADSKIDFSQYDQDSDGFVDNVYIFYAGQSEAEYSEKPDLIWPHQYYIYSGEGIRLVLDGKQIDRYACSSEISGRSSLTGIGPFCHEFAHTFGLADLYDTDYDYAGGWAAGTWNTTSLMDGGSYNNNSATPPNFNCIEREMLGLSEPESLRAGSSYTLDPIHLNNTCFRLDSNQEGEYYLFECRSDEGWDKYIGGNGMLVYHIDRIATERDGGYEYSKWEYNTVNATVSHQCADLIEADGRSDRINSDSDFDRSMRGLFFPQDNVTAITPEGKPSFKFWYGYMTDLSVTGIRRSGDNVSFNVSRYSDTPELPSVADLSFQSFPDGAVIMFSKNDPALEGTPAVEWRKSGDGSEYAKATVFEYQTGKYACRLRGLESGNISYETQIRFEQEGNIGESERLSFMTKRKPPVDWPYMHIKDNTIDEDGIVLHVVNAADASDITWSFNDRDIPEGLDIIFKPSKDGTLKAYVTWKDGSRDIITKELEVEK